MACWDTLFDQTRGAFAQQRTAERARTLALSALTCLGRRTLSGLLCTAGQQFRDWSAAYRLFERERLAVACPAAQRAEYLAVPQPRGGPAR
jgi:hypothetical protein